MTARERVLRAVEHEETDRLPRDYHAEGPITEGLLKALRLRDAESLKNHLKVDMETLGVPFNCPYTDGRNIFGIQSHSSRDGKTLQVDHPLADVKTVEDVEAYRWPDPDWADIKGLRKQLIQARKSGRFVVCSSWGSIFGETYRLMSMEEFMVGLHTVPDVVHAIIRKLTDFFLEVDRRVFTACEGLIDMSFHGNDMGTQLSLLFSGEMFDRFFAGPFREMNAQAHRFGLKTMMHSCGAVAGVLPDIIACGYDALDPVQFTATGMHPRELKPQFGDAICFHGCISAQKVLPLGTPAEVREHVKEVCEIMKPGGGYIFCSDQAITHDSPIENVLTMYEAVESTGY